MVEVVALPSRYAAYRTFYSASFGEVLETMAWTDDRMDDLVRHVDAGFGRTDSDATALRAEMRAGFARTDRDIAALRTEMQAGFQRTDRDVAALRAEMHAGFGRADRDVAALRAEMHEGFRDVRAECKSDIGELRMLTVRFGISIVVGLLSLVVALIGAIVAGPLGG